jgi:hypothetical protein
MGLPILLGVCKDDPDKTHSLHTVLATVRSGFHVPASMQDVLNTSKNRKLSAEGNPRPRMETLRSLFDSSTPDSLILMKRTRYECRRCIEMYMYMYVYMYTSYISIYASTLFVRSPLRQCETARRG